jgi:hypothetical protein
MTGILGCGYLLVPPTIVYQNRMPVPSVRYGESPKAQTAGWTLSPAPGPLGFGSPRTCVQVKSQDALVGRPEIDQLMGVMKKVQANEALFVSISS